MKAARSLTFFTGIALLGFGGAVLARALTATDGTSVTHEPHNADAAVPYGAGTRIDKAFTINRSADDLYRVWRDFEKLPSILSHLTGVEVLDEHRSRWHARGPKGPAVSWEAEIIDERPNERIAWRSIGGTVPNAGSVRFREAPGGRGTELRVEMEWRAPGGPLGASFAQLFGGGDPGLIVESDLRRFKATMEAGDVALNGTDVTK
jgi:uncharacterized membrane protein